MHFRIPTALVLAALVAAGCAGTPSAGGISSTVDLGPILSTGLDDIDGNHHDLSRATAEGKELVLVFWQPWCQTCISEVPRIQAAAEQHSGEQAFFGVVSGPDGAVDEERVREIVMLEGLSYGQLRDRSLELTKALAIDSTPTIVILGTDGRVRYRSHNLPAAWR